ncbi:MAG: hypothetical protein MJ202_06860 [Lentisphaeria bacterium]|nr:hypothetical protein [Lentisphaeria bacterium]
MGKRTVRLRREAKESKKAKQFRLRREAKESKKAKQSKVAFSGRAKESKKAKQSKVAFGDFAEGFCLFCNFACFALRLFGKQEQSHGITIP